MASENLGSLYTNIEANLKPLDQGIKQAERMARDGARRIEKASEVGISGGASGSGLGGAVDHGIKIAAGIQAAATAFSALNVAASIFSGNMEDARESLFQMPLGIGQMARQLDSLLDKLMPGASLAETNAKIEANELDIKKRNQLAKSQNELRRGAVDRANAAAMDTGRFGLEGFDKERADIAAERFDKLQKLRADEEEAKRLKLDIYETLQFEYEQIDAIAKKKTEAVNKREQAQKDKADADAFKKNEEWNEEQIKLGQQYLDEKFRNEEEFAALKDKNDVMALEQTDKVAAKKLAIEREAEADIRKAIKDNREDLVPEIERRKGLQLAAMSRGTGQQIDDIARMVTGTGDGLRGVGKDVEPVTKKQGDTQIGVLRDMLAAITRLKLEATAN